jgi:signal transduction histidine kinase
VPSAPIVAEALDRFADRIRTSGARIAVNGDMPELPVHRTWAVEALSNLLSNALKFTRDGEAPEIEIGAYLGDEGAGICVRDRGPGVPAELQEKIFKLFQRGVGREIEGTGAGLAIVREIARRHGGEAFVRPRSGGGSEFVVTFGRDSHASDAGASASSAATS